MSRKKILLFITITFMFIVCVFMFGGCAQITENNGNPYDLNVSASSNNVSENKGTTISLTKDNFSKYVATNSSSDTVYNANTGYYDIIYYTYFIGSKHCKFIDCTITCRYSSDEYTVQLNLSGDGEVPTFNSNSKRFYLYSLEIISVSGTVEIIA